MPQLQSPVYISTSSDGTEWTYQEFILYTINYWIYGGASTLPLGLKMAYPIKRRLT